MIKTITTLVISLLFLSFEGVAADRITASQIQAVIEKTDAAAKKRDVDAIGDYLSKKFSRSIEVPDGDWVATVRLDKTKYLAVIADGWKQLDEYSYERKDTRISVAPDGLSGKSNSTITENVVSNDERVVSKIREYAEYTLEDGKPVITTIESHTLVGDTTPGPKI